MSLENLKKNFDRVIITHQKEGNNKGTKVVLVKGLKLFIGESKVHENDSFNRKLGRVIASGRAEFAFKVENGEKPARTFKSTEYKATPLNKTITCKDTKELDNVILTYLPEHKAKEAS